MRQYCQNTFKEKTKLIGRKCEISTMWASMSYDFETLFWRNQNRKTTQRLRRKWNFLTSTPQHNQFFKPNTTKLACEKSKISMWKIQNRKFGNPVFVKISCPQDKVFSQTTLFGENILSPEQDISIYR